MSARSMMLAVLALALASATCQPAAQEAGPLSEEEAAAIRAVVDGVVEAELANDWEGVAVALTEDVVSMPANEPVIEGRDAWLAWVASMGFNVLELTTEVLDVDGRDGIAYLRSSYSETFTAAGVAEPVEEEGKCVWIFQKQADGSWLVSTWICNSDLPLARAGS
ncbi:MAG: DUF4440 domain-containing protein [Gemmatimonadota bacterium]|nr:MAG: DUF4440 domain-containing protein [Gemmatimonadota bacterium]